MPNMPTTAGMKPTPSRSSVLPQVSRAAPETTSCPTVASNKPRNRARKHLIKLPLASEDTITKARIMTAKYSGGPKSSANLLSGTAIRVRNTKPIVPAMNEPIAATPSAAPPRPARAIG